MEIPMNRRTFISISAVSLFSGLLSGCGKKKYQPKPPVETLEEAIKEREEYIKEAEKIYKEQLAEAKKHNDKERVAYLKATNEDRLKNEKKMLEMEKKELEKERKKAGK